MSDRPQFFTGSNAEPDEEIGTYPAKTAWGCLIVACFLVLLTVGAVSKGGYALALLPLGLAAFCGYVYVKSLKPRTRLDIMKEVLGEACTADWVDRDEAAKERDENQRNALLRSALGVISGDWRTYEVGRRDHDRADIDYLESTAYTEENPEPKTLQELNTILSTQGTDTLVRQPVVSQYHAKKLRTNIRAVASDGSTLRGIFILPGDTGETFEYHVRFNSRIGYWEVLDF